MENLHGKYLKISKKISSSRSTIIVPINGVAWFLDLFNYYVDGDDEEVLSKELQLDAKVFYFDVGVNKRGRFLKISEASTTYSRSIIIVPVGNTRKDGWAAFRNILAEINEASQQGSANTISKPSIGGPFTLTDHDGKPITDREFLGHWTSYILGTHPLPIRIQRNFKRWPKSLSC